MQQAAGGARDASGNISEVSRSVEKTVRMANRLLELPQQAELMNREVGNFLARVG